MWHGPLHKIKMLSFFIWILSFLVFTLIIVSTILHAIARNSKNTFIPKTKKDYSFSLQHTKQKRCHPPWKRWSSEWSTTFIIKRSWVRLFQHPFQSSMSPKVNLRCMVCGLVYRIWFIQCTLYDKWLWIKRCHPERSDRVGESWFS